MLFLGDIMQHEAQLNSAYRGEGNRGNPNSYNYSPYFKNLNSYFAKVDIVAANMETTFAPPPYKGYPAFCSPSSLAREALSVGIDLFFAANNHSVDRGASGIEGSISLYKELGVLYTGIYLNEQEEALKHPLIIESRG
ncbi:MAG: CapA family protein, partial [Bacteroidales bacterium]